MAKQKYDIVNAIHSFIKDTNLYDNSKVYYPISIINKVIRVKGLRTFYLLPCQLSYSYLDLIKLFPCTEITDINNNKYYYCPFIFYYPKPYSFNNQFDYYYLFYNNPIIISYNVMSLSKQIEKKNKTMDLIEKCQIYYRPLVISSNILDINKYKGYKVTEIKFVLNHTLQKIYNEYSKNIIKITNILKSNADIPVSISIVMKTFKKLKLNNRGIITMEHNKRRRKKENDIIENKIAYIDDTEYETIIDVDYNNKVSNINNESMIGLVPKLDIVYDEEYVCLINNFKILK